MHSPSSLQRTPFTLARWRCTCRHAACHICPAPLHPTSACSITSPPRQPSIIQSDGDNPENKTLVMELVKGYIKESRTIIVAAVS